MLDSMKERRTIRRYSEEKISDKLLEELLEIARSEERRFGK